MTFGQNIEIYISEMARNACKRYTMVPGGHVVHWMDGNVPVLRVSFSGK